MKKTTRPLLVSFSGLDGAGKSTQIDNLRAYLARQGYRTELMAFWDDVVTLKPYREGFMCKVYNSERGVGAPDRPVERRDKNVRKGYLTVVRHLLYFLDALHLVTVIAKARKRGADVIIMDRYIYDQLANLPLHRRLTRAYLRVVERLVPCPDLAYVLDADPEEARARKPEYPVDFMRECRKAYYRLADLLGTMTIIPPLPLEAAKDAVVGAFNLLLARRRHVELARRQDAAEAA